MYISAIKTGISFLEDSLTLKFDMDVVNIDTIPPGTRCHR